MPGKVTGVPEGVHITPHMVIRNAAKAIEFYQKAFGAKLGELHNTPDGRVMHARVRIGDSHLMMSDEFSGMGHPSPQTLGGSPVVFTLYVEDVDRVFNQAVKAGAKVTMPLANQFWGDRYGQVVDPFGHHWALAAHVEDVAPDELERRSEAVFAEMVKKMESS